MRCWCLLALLLITSCLDTAVITQPDPVSLNQTYMLGEVRRLEPMLGMGRFVALFERPMVSTYAGWATCQPGGGRPPYYVYFNKDYVELIPSESGKPYMSGLVAHEMCHHWIAQQHLNCWDEQAAEVCAFRLLNTGKPN